MGSPIGTRAGTLTRPYLFALLPEFGEGLVTAVPGAECLRKFAGRS